MPGRLGATAKERWDGVGDAGPIREPEPELDAGRAAQPPGSAEASEYSEDVPECIDEEGAEGDGEASQESGGSAGPDDAEEAASSQGASQPSAPALGSERRLAAERPGGDGVEGGWGTPSRGSPTPPAAELDADVDPRELALTQETPVAADAGQPADVAAARGDDALHGALIPHMAWTASALSKAPRPPKGAPSAPRRRCFEQQRPRRKLDEKQAFSEAELRRRAQTLLERTTARVTAKNIPSLPNYPQPFADVPPLKLEDMSPLVQGTFIRAARYEAEEWFKHETERYAMSRTKAMRHRERHEDLERWYEERQRREEEERLREERLAQEAEERERQREARRRRRGDRLRQTLAAWGQTRADAEQAERVEEAARRAAEEERRRKRESEYRSQVKTELDDWRRKKAEEEALLQQEARERSWREAEEEESRRLRMEERRELSPLDSGGSRRQRRQHAPHRAFCYG